MTIGVAERVFQLTRCSKTRQVSFCCSAKARHREEMTGKSDGGFEKEHDEE